MTYRVGVIDYLNARPLTWAIEQGLVDGLSGVSAVPSQLAELLAGGQVQAAIVSSVVALREPGLALLPEAGCIAADGPVQSVLLFSKVHVAQIRTVALDRSSLSSVALVRVLLELHHGLRPEYRSMAPHLGEMLAEADAALLIGDPGLAQYSRDLQQTPVYDVLDLGREWREWTGLPFVFAAWIAPRSLADSPLPGLLRRARELSGPCLEDIVADAVRRLGIPAEVCRHYLTTAIRYEFGDREREGYELFGQYLRRLDPP